MIVVTGGAGFIGSNLVASLNEKGIDEIIIVDRLGKGEKWKNLNGLNFIDFIHKDDFYEMIVDETFPYELEAIFHLGACSSTTEKDADYLIQNNFTYSVELAKYAAWRDIRFIYASSAATYGDGSNGYNDLDEIYSLRPLNMYGYSKQLFDSWIIKNGYDKKTAGLKYFNVYGPNEYHKDDMRSVVHKAFGQIKSTGYVNLFKSYHKDYKDGEQMRDFIYIKDAVDMTLFFFENKDVSGLFNIGTGKARTWNDLVTAVFNAMEIPVKIKYIEMPEDIRDKYQYFTQADLNKIKEAGYEKKITSLEDGIKDYIQNYLMKNVYLKW